MKEFLRTSLKISCFAAAFLISTHPLALAQGAKGSLAVSVVQLGGRGEPVADKEVMLHILKAKEQEKMEHGKTDRNGKFTFQGLAADADHTYVAMVEHLGVPYSSELVQFAQGETSKELTIKVAETTTVEKDISLAREHLIFETESNNLKVTDIIIIENKGEKAYIGSKELSQGVREVLKFNLPSGFRQFRGLQGIDSYSYFMTDEGFIYTLGIPPGLTQIAFSYLLDLTYPRYQFSRAADYNIDSLDLLVGDPKLKVESPSLQSQGMAKIGAKEFLHLAGAGFKKGSRLVVAISTDGIAPGTAIWTQHKWIPFSLIAIFIMAGVAYPYIRKRRGASARRARTKIGEAELENRGIGPYRELQAEREELFADIAGLDEKFEAGELPAEEYSKLRAEKKKRLVQVMRTLKGAGID